MSEEDSYRISGELLQFISDIDPNILKTTDHSTYLSRLVAVAELALKQDRTLLLIIVQNIKDCKRPSYKRDILIDSLEALLYSDDVRNLILHPDGTAIECKKLANFATTLVSIPDILANCGCPIERPKFKRDHFYHHILSNLILTIQAWKSDTALTIDYKIFVLQILNKIAINDREVFWTSFLAEIISPSHNDTFKQHMRSIYSLPLDGTYQDKIFDCYIDQLYSALFLYKRPTILDEEVWKFLGANALDNKELQYMLCDKFILQANYDLPELQQKITLFNIFDYLSFASSRSDEHEASALTDLLEKVLSSWSDGTKLLLRLNQHNRYVTWALIVGFRFALEHRREYVAQQAGKYQAGISKALPLYLNRSDESQRALGMNVASIILGELHKLSGPSKEADIEFPNLASLTLNNSSFTTAKELFCLGIDEIFADQQSIQPKRFNTQTYEKPPDQRSKKTKTTEEYHIPKKVSTNKKVVDIDDEDSGDSSGRSDDEAFGEVVAHVPIYLRDCLNGLIDHSSSYRYTKLCLARAAELVERFAAEHNELDTIRDVGVELARVVLHADNQYNIKQFDSYRSRIMISLCAAAPELAANYMLEEFNGPSRGLRLQLDILHALVASAQILSEAADTKSTTAAEHLDKSIKGQGKINKFARYVPLYFYGIIHRLRADFSDDPSAALTYPKPESVLSAFRALKQRGLTSDQSTDAILTRAIKGQEEKPLVPIFQHLISNSAPTSSSSSEGISGSKVLELDTVSDDSYLLSRILTSVAMILKCASQQPILCRISTDFLKVLCAYRCHPDSGVQKSIIVCLKTIQECTPNVYFSQYLEDSMVKQFAAWLESKS